MGRYLPGAALGKAGFCTSWAIGAGRIKAGWLEVVELELSLANLDERFHGKRIVHISDLHCGRTVSSKYLRKCIHTINRLNADIVVLTGDYITHDYRGHFRKKVVNLLSAIQSRHGVYACLGNHDYGIGGVFRANRDEELEQMIYMMEHHGLNVLRNDSGCLQIDGRKLWFVGLGDLWADDLEPKKAFAGIDDDGAVIALAHNPSSVKHLKGFTFDALMSGHTHGAKVEMTVSIEGPTLKSRRHYAGLYQLGEKQLYVNRGLGRSGEMFFSTRPEITVFNLCPEA